MRKTSKKFTALLLAFVLFASHFPTLLFAEAFYDENDSATILDSPDTYTTQSALTNDTTTDEALDLIDAAELTPWSYVSTISNPSNPSKISYPDIVPEINSNQLLSDFKLEARLNEKNSYDGKIAGSTEEGKFYNTPLDSAQNFILSAELRMSELAIGIASANQGSAGLMVTQNLSNGVSNKNMALVGTFGGTTINDAVIKSRYRTSTAVDNTFKKAYKDETYRLELKKVGHHIYYTVDGIPLAADLGNSFSNPTNYVGFYIARYGTANFSNATLVTDGDTVKEVSEILSFPSDSCIISTGFIDGSKMHVKYVDGSEGDIDISDVYIENLNINQEGTQTVNIWYNGLKQEETVHVRSSQVTKMELVSPPQKSLYYATDIAPDLSGMSMNVSYSNGTTVQYTWPLNANDESKFAATGYSNTGDPKQTITVTPTDGSEHAISFDITLSDASLKKITILNPPIQNNYNVGDDYQLLGLQVLAYYTDGAKVFLTPKDYIVEVPTDFNKDVAGTYTFNVKYHNAMETFQLQYDEIRSEGLIVTQYPKTTYTTGETLNLHDLSVGNLKSDGSITPLILGTDYTLDTTSVIMTTPGESNVTIQGIGNYAVEKSIHLLIAVRDATTAQWNQVFFGQSTGETNVNNGNLKITQNPDGSVDIRSVGGSGKVTESHDGMAMYYTVLDPEKDNFKLSADITIHQFLNSTTKVSNNQEAFGIVARDIANEGQKLGQVNSSNMAFVGAYRSGIYNNKVQGFIRSKITDIGGGGGQLGYPEGINLDKSYPIGSDLNETLHLQLEKTNSGFIFRVDGGGDQNGVEQLVSNNMLSTIDSKKMYVGFFAAREADITVQNIKLEVTNAASDPPKVSPPEIPVKPVVSFLSNNFSSTHQYNLVYQANVNGIATIYQDTTELGRFLKLSKGKTYETKVTLTNDKTVFYMDFVPDPKQPLTNYDTVSISMPVQKQRLSSDVIYVSPTGSESNSGAEKSPLDLETAVKLASPGQKIVLLDGIYKTKNETAPDKRFHIQRFNDGKPGQYKTIEAKTLHGAILEGGLWIEGDYWHIKGMNVTKSPIDGITIEGSHNILEMVDAHDNGDTGILIGGINSTRDRKDWPSYNLVKNCTSYQNRDASENNADGFAAKLRCGAGNVFDGCIAHHNIDDGWDLYSKVGTGAIDPVIVRNSIAYRNGYYFYDGEEKVSKGDGNGFKLGGENLPVAHVIENCISFSNTKNGITTNSDPAVLFKNLVSYSNGTSNYAIYTLDPNVSRTWLADNLISYNGGESDNVSQLLSVIGGKDSNYFQSKANEISKNGSDENFTGDAYFSSVQEITPYSRDANGNIIWGEFLMYDAFKEFLAAPFVSPTDPNEGKSKYPSPDEIVLPDNDKTYTVSVHSTTGGTVTGGGVFVENTVVTLVATPNPQYIFNGWFEDGTQLPVNTEEYVFAVSTDRSIEARFTFIDSNGTSSSNHHRWYPPEMEPTTILPENAPQGTLESEKVISLDTQVNPTIELTSNETVVEISGATLGKIVAENKTVTLKKNIFTLVMNPKNISELDLTSTDLVRIEIQNAPKIIRDDYFKMNAQNKALSSTIYSIQLFVNGKSIRKFTTPIELRIDLNPYSFGNVTKSKLTGIRFVNDQVYQQLGGILTPDHIFVFKTSTFSDYGVLFSDTLISIVTSIGQSTYTLNGKQKSLDVTPRIMENTTMVPVRFISEAFGAQVDWNESTKKVTIQLDDKTLSMTIGEKLPGLDISPVIVDGRTLVPLRYFAETLDTNVIWNEENQQIELNR